ncbi:hypothetical protein NLG97_g6537 [Lecanicillium saksenae]|uniref:Uncharacterized protein n=1 Tax=Lecanicillium saksenae TaxID=468837 RepID=A0ACC1QPH1_9HYPO|nr:hypothetical protein NLG97_g6537 [Lecanicillium saksenae]
MQNWLKLAYLSLAAREAAASLLYASSYDGKISTLNVTDAAGSDNPSSMKIVTTSKGCGANPSWLRLDHANALLYCVDEGFDTGGSLSALRTNDDGSLTALDTEATKVSPVSAVFFGNHGLAMAHYDNAFTTWNVGNPSKLKNVQTQTFTGKGPDHDRQEGPHPHQAVLDPSGKYLLVPDLGTDQVHVFSFNANTLKFTAQTNLKVPGGYGPRHLAFASRGDKTFMYLMTEMANTIIGYQVTYANGIQFKQLFAHGTHGKGTTNKKGAEGSEIVVSSDNKFLIASSVGDLNLKIPAFGGSGTIKSDPLVNYAIEDDGSLTLLQEVPAGGNLPRQFSVNKAGTRVAVGLQNDHRVVVIERDPKTGKMGKFVAYANVSGEATCVVFNE